MIGKEGLKKRGQKGKGKAGIDKERRSLLSSREFRDEDEGGEVR